MHGRCWGQLGSCWTSSWISESWSWVSQKRILNMYTIFALFVRINVLLFLKSCKYVNLIVDFRQNCNSALGLLGLLGLASYLQVSSCTEINMFMYYRYLLSIKYTNPTWCAFYYTIHDLEMRIIQYIDTSFTFMAYLSRILENMVLQTLFNLYRAF